MNDLKEINKTVENNELKVKKRPQILTVFLILSMVSGAVSLLSNIFIYSLIDSFREILGESDKFNLMGMEMDISLFLDIDKNFFLIQAILYLGSFSGALMMWNFKKAGFHIYTLSQILLLIAATVYLPGLPFPYPDIMITGIFVYVYAKNLSLMR